MRLDDEIRKINDRHWTAEQNRALQKTAILVEGEDDRESLEIILDVTRGRGWRTSVHIIAAGGHKKVLEKRSLFPHPHSLIDRDVRTDQEVDDLQKEYAFLHVTDGWCFENVFLSPDFLRFHFPFVVAEVDSQRERWVRAGAVWWTLQRAHEHYHRGWDRLRASPYGRPRADFDPSSAAEFCAGFPVAPAAPVEIEELAHTFEARLRDVEAMAECDQWRLGVHGKEAFKQLLIPSLERHYGGSGWRVKLLERVGRPAPLDEMLAILRL